MTPRQKAIDLLDKFASRNQLGLPTSKKYALIAVEEIKKAHPLYELVEQGNASFIKYIWWWNQVTLEIKKL